MKDVIEFIIKDTHWRLLPTGRIKGDFKFSFTNTKGETDFKIQKGIITFEYRDDGHKSFVIGASGANNGLKLMKILSQNINFVDITMI